MGRKVAFDRYRWQWIKLLSCLSDEQFLAERNFGVEDLHPKKHKDIIDQMKGRAEGASKMLEFAKQLSKEGRERERQQKEPV